MQRKGHYLSRVAVNRVTVYRAACLTHSRNSSAQRACAEPDLPEDELCTEAQSKGIFKAGILHQLYDPAPAEAGLQLNKAA